MIESIKWLFAKKHEKLFTLTVNFLLMSKIVAFNPEYIKCAQITDKEEKEQLDKLAVAMGYVPSKDEVMQSEYVQKSFSLMETAIKKRPELIKYAIKTEFGSNFSDEQFNDLAKQAINCGYIPSENDLSKNPRQK